MKKLLLLIIPLLFVLASCQHQGPPPNPFESVEVPTPPVALPPPDSSTIVGLHEYIFSVSCAVPGCHDGNFEPDFRTVQSSYSTLVWQPVIKNTLDEAYEVRVKPNDVEASWLYNRVTTQDSILGRMPLYDSPLNASQLKAIRDWINAGAPDMFGQASDQPNTHPQFGGVAAYLQFGPTWYRVDTIRQNFSPFGTLSGRTMRIWFLLEDDSTPISELKNTRIQLSSNPDGFPSNQELMAQYSATPQVVPDFLGPGKPAEFYWYVELNTGNYPANAVTFFRLYTQDGDHTEDFEFPRNSHPREYKGYMAFFVTL